MMTTADYYWSLDAYVRRDHYVLTNSTDVVAMTTPIETADRDSRKVVPDRNGKGYALEIGDQDDQWLQLGEYKQRSLPHKCGHVLKGSLLTLTGGDILVIHKCKSYTFAENSITHCSLTTPIFYMRYGAIDWSLF